MLKGSILDQERGFISLDEVYYIEKIETENILYRYTLKFHLREGAHLKSITWNYKTDKERNDMFDNIIRKIFSNT